jgi:predicted transcriptional regulator of viral defense system
MNVMDPHVSFTHFAQSTPLFTLKQARDRYAKDAHSRSILNMLHRLKRQGRVRQLAHGVYSGALASTPPNRYLVPSALREDAVVAFHSALEWHGVANQVFQTVYYFSARPRKDVIFDNVTYHRVAPPRALRGERHKLFQVQLGADHVLVTERERSFVDCLIFLDYSGGVEELDKSLAMFPSFDFDAVLKYLKLLRKPWLYSRLGFLLDRHADKLFFRGEARDHFLRKLPPGVAYLGTKRPGNRWVPTWRLMVPDTLAPPGNSKITT